MDRLTMRNEQGVAVMDCMSCRASWMKKRGKDMPDCTALYCRNRLKDRLAEYEDTGLEPDEVKTLQKNNAGTEDSDFQPEKIREFRRNANMTQDQLAEAIGVGYTVVCKYEKGIVVPSTKRLEEIAKALNVPVSAFFCRGQESTSVSGKTKTVLYKALYEDSPNNQLWKFNPASFTELMFLLNFLANEQNETVASREERIMALLNGETVCTNLAAYKLVKEELP